MDRIPVSLRYDGYWNDALNFIGYKVAGLAVNFSTSFKDFKNNVVERLGIDVKCEDLKIEFQASAGEPAMEIDCDDFFQYFLACKSQATSVFDFPLCITKFAVAPPTDQGSDFEQGLLSVIDFDQLDDQICVDGASSSSNVFGLSSNVHDLYIEGITNDVISVIDCFSEEDSVHEEDEGSVFSCFKIDSIYKGQVFKDRDTCRRAVSFFALKNGFQVSVYKSCPSQYYLKCRIKGCDWNFRSSRSKYSGCFVVRKYEGEHTCNIDLRNRDKPQASTLLIANHIKRSFYRVQRVYNPGDIMDDVRDTLGVKLSYKKAWRAREEALRYIRGTAAESYGHLPSLMYMMGQSNPGSAFIVQTDSARRFKYMFMAFHACIQGWQHCRPVVVVDGTFLKTAYNGTLLTACGYDASERLYPLAFAVVDGENDESWEWFFREFKTAFGERPDLVVVSDRHSSIEKGCKEVFPGVMHGICTYHLMQNLKTIFRKKGDEISKYFKRAAYSYTRENFDKNMSVLANINPDITKYLIDVGVGKWSRAYASRNRYSAMTSNNAESLNAMSLAARSLPISSLAAYLRNLLQKRFKDNRSIALKTQTELTTRFYNKIQKKYDIASRMEVVQADDVVATVRRNGIEHVVNMLDRTCSCRRFDVDEIPCAHALAVIRDKRLLSSDFMSPYFTKEKMLASYAESIMPIPSRDQWEIPEQILCTVVLPPVVATKAGRPRKRRLKNHFEEPRKLVCHCSNCGEANHNKRTCKGAKDRSSSL